MPKGVPRDPLGKFFRRKPLPGGRAPRKHRSTLGDEGQVEPTFTGEVHPTYFKSSYWSPVLPTYEGRGYSDVKIYDGAGKLLRIVTPAPSKAAEAPSWRATGHVTWQHHVQRMNAARAKKRR
jgi:hypothetical protein